MPQFTRRRFIQSSTALIGGFAILPSIRASGGDSHVNIAVVGLRQRGNTLIKDVLRSPNTRLAALCDVDTEVLAKIAADVESEHGLKPLLETDLRRLLERSDIDAVVLATPNHLHALQTIWACQAGKDVYVEKPVCHTVWEGRRMLEAANKYGRIVQSGFQNRSDVGLKEAFAWLKEGNLGKIKAVRGLCYRNRGSIGRAETPIEPPASVNYDLWLGPAADLRLDRPQFHYDWHWVWNTGNGDIGNQGPHEMDLMRWILDEPQHPTEVTSLGGRFGWNDAGETPNMQIASFTLGSTPTLFEVRNLWVNPETNSAPHFKGNRVGIVVTYEGGEFRGGRGGGFAYDHDGKRMQAFKGDGGYDHFPSFVRAVQSRKQSDLACDLETGYRSSVLGHLCNISHQTGSPASPKTMASHVAKDPSLEETYQRFEAQLDAWKVDRESEKWILGSALAFDPAAERFTAGKERKQANALLRRKDREGYKVPAKV